jgi:hypothetical protein
MFYRRVHEGKARPAPVLLYCTVNETNKDSDSRNSEGRRLLTSYEIPLPSFPTVSYKWPTAYSVVSLLLLVFFNTIQQFLSVTAFAYSLGKFPKT